MLGLQAFNDLLVTELGGRFVLGGVKAQVQKRIADLSGRNYLAEKLTLFTCPTLSKHVKTCENHFKTHLTVVMQAFSPQFPTYCLENSFILSSGFAFISSVTFLYLSRMPLKLVDFLGTRPSSSPRRFWDTWTRTPRKTMQNGSNFFFSHLLS